MALGEGLVDADGARHEMLGLLPVSTSFAARKLHLGYRKLKALGGPYAEETLNAHEFHYACVTKMAPPNLFEAQDSMGVDLGNMGHQRGKVSGSFAHLIMSRV